MNRHFSANRLNIDTASRQWGVRFVKYIFYETWDRHSKNYLNILQIKLRTKLQLICRSNNGEHKRHIRLKMWPRYWFSFSKVHFGLCPKRRLFVIYIFRTDKILEIWTRLKSQRMSKRLINSHLLKLPSPEVLH